MLHRLDARTFGRLIGAALLLPLQTAAWPASFPQTSLQTLSGTAFQIPGSLEGRVNILVLGFTRRAGSNTGPWLEALRRDFRSADGFVIYSVAVLAGVPAPFRPVALAITRAGIPAEQRDRFLIVQDDEQTWRSMADYRLPDDPYVIVLDKAGNILYRTGGLFEETAYQKTAEEIRGGRNGPDTHTGR